MLDIDFDKVLEIFGLIVGLVYLYYEWKANPRVWIAGIIMPAISLFIYFSKGLYADFAMNVYYFLMAIYGYIAWTMGFSRKRSAKAERPITHVPLMVYPVIIIALGALWWLIAAGLIYGTNSNVPVTDAFTTAASIVATWMLARKYAEQWLVWLAVDAVCVPLYIYKGIYFYASLYALYTVIAFFGYLKWLRLMRHTR